MPGLRRVLTLLCLCSVGLVRLNSTPAADPTVYSQIAVDPLIVELTGPRARFTLLVSARTPANFVVDVAEHAQFESLTPELCAVNERGIISSRRDGAGRIAVTVGETRLVVDVTVRNSQVAPQFHFERDIVPILSRFGCNTSGCHGKAEGQNGFKLSVFGFDPPADYAALLFEARGRRISLTRPEESLLLRKASGGSPHGGGVRIARGSLEYESLRDWIQAGAPLGSASDPQVASIELTPRERTLPGGLQQQLRVIATYTDGQRKDVTPLAKFQSNQEGLAIVDEHGRVTVGQTSGEVAVMAAFMGHVDVFRASLPQLKVPVGDDYPAEQNVIDRLVHAKLRTLRIVPSEVCSDADFLRRAALDITGTLPTAEQSQKFLADASPTKRAALVDQLLQQPEYADYWALKWADLLRVDRGKLGHRAAYDYYRWIRDSFAQNRPFDQFARELITAEGLLTEQPAGHFYQVLTQPGERASTISQVFLGVRIECAQCHHHPYDRWSQQDYVGMQGFFTQPTFKNTARGQLLFTTETVADLKHPRTGDSVPAYPLGAVPTATSDHRRQQLADWMTAPQNPWFARNVVNRMWAHFTGRGIIEPVDDTRLTNPPSNPELLDALAQNFIDCGYDLHALIRLMTSSRTYQLSTEPNATNAGDELNYSRAWLRPLEAEVLLDALCATTDVPEKFPGVPAGYRAVQLWDSQVQHEFLKIFGRPVRATACQCERVAEPTVAQVLKVMNSPLVQSKLTHAGGRVARWTASTLSPGELAEEMYLTFFNRLPDDAEAARAAEFLARPGSDRRQAIEDLAWSLLNSTEFVFNH